MPEITARAGDGASVATWLADAAARVTAGPVGIVCGFDRDSRVQARRLQQRLALHGTESTEVPPALLTGTRSDLTGPNGQRLELLIEASGRRDLLARQVAARLGIPLLTIGSIETETIPVLGLHRDGQLWDVAVTSFDLAPDSQSASHVTLLLDGTPLLAPLGGTVTATIAGHAEVRCTVRTLIGASTHDGSRLTAEPASGFYTLARDRAPIEDLTRPVEITVLPDRT